MELVSFSRAFSFHPGAKPLSAVILLACVAVLTCITSGCNDKDYDLSKSIDTTLDIEGNISMPIGSSEFIPISDILGIDGDVIDIDDDGTYYLNLLSPSTFTGLVDTDFSMDVDNLQDVAIHVDLSSYNGGSGSGTYQTKIPDGSELDISVNSETVDWLLEISHATIDEGTMHYNVTVSEGNVTLKSGTEITFPDFLILDNPDTHDGYSVTDHHKINVSSDLTATASKPLVLSAKITDIDLTQIPDGQGVVEEDGQKRIILNDKVSIEGNMEIDLSTFSSVPSEVVVDLSISQDSFSVKDATVRLDITQAIDDQEIDVDDMPDILKGEGTVIDLYNPVFTFKAQNSTPIDLYINADVDALVGGESTLSAPLHIGAAGDADNSTEDIEIAANTTTTFYLSKRGYDGAAAGEQNIIMSRMQELFSAVPEEVRIENIALSSDPDEYVTIEAKEYSFSISSRIDAVLAFGADMKISYETSLTGLNGIFGDSDDDDSDFSFNVDELALSLNIVSSIPVGLSLDAVPIDLDGNSISGITVSVSGTVAPGTTANPVSSPITLNLKASGGSALDNFDGLMLTVTGSSDSSVAGTALNTDQGIRLTDISAKIVGGISTTL